MRWLAAVVLGGGLIAPAQAQLGVSKTRAPDALYAGTKYVGDVSAFLIRISNNFVSGDITGVAFTDTMPAGFKVAGAGVVSTSCVDGNGASVPFSGTVGAAPGSQSISLSGGVIPSRNGGTEAGRCDIVVEVTSTSAGAGNNILNVGAVTGQHVPEGAIANGEVAQQSLTFEALDAPSLSKEFAGGTIVKADEPTRLTLTIHNNSGQPLPLNGAGDSPAFALRDRLGDYGLKVAPTPSPQINCGAAPPSFAPSAGATVITALGGTVPANGTCSVSVMVVADGVGNAYSTDITNVIDRNTDFGNRRALVPAANASASLTVTAPLRVSKSFSPATVAAGQEAQLTITLTNASPLTDLTLLAFSDDIDGAGSGLSITSAPSASCTGGSSLSGLGGAGGQTLSYSGGTLKANSSCTITVPYTGTLAVPGTPQSFTNSIAAGGVPVSDPGVFSQAASASVNVVDQLLVEKTGSPSVVAPGNPVRFNVRVANYSTGSQSGIAITDALPGGMQLLTTPQKPAPSLSGAGCVANSLSVGGSAGTPVFSFDMLAGSNGDAAVCNVEFWAMAPAGASDGAVLINTLNQGDVCRSGGPCNHYASSAQYSVSTSVLALEKTFDATSKPEGAAATMTISLVNLSAQPVTAVNLTDVLPTGSNGTPMQVANPANASSTCAGASISALAGATTVGMSGATVPARADGGLGDYGRCTFTVNVVGAAGDYTNTLPAGAATGTETLADGGTRALSSPGPVSRNIQFLSALGATKVFTPNRIQSGGRATVTLRLSNSQAGVLNNVSIVDNLPSGMTVADPAQAYSTCDGPVAISAEPGAGSVSLSGARLPTGSCDLLFDVTATGSDNWVNTILAGGLTADGGVRNVAPIQATLQNASGGGISIGINHADASIAAPGAVTQLTINLFNNGSLDLSNLSLASYFTADGTATGAPTGERIAGVVNASTTCQGGLVSAAPGGTSLALSGASLGAGQSCTVTANVTMVTAGTVVAQVPVGSVSSDQGVSNTQPVSTSLQTGSGIGVAKQFTPAVIEPNQRSRLRITFYNPTTEPATALALTDSWAAGGMSPASPANSVNTCGGSLTLGAGNLQLSGAALAAGSAGTPASCYVEFDMTAASAGDYLNTIPSGALTAMIDSSPATNSQGTSDTLRVKAPLSVHKAIAGRTLDAGNPGGFSTGSAAAAAGAGQTLSIRIDNPNATALTGLAFTDALPDGLVVAPTPALGNSCGGVVTATPSATQVRLNGGTLAGNSACTVTVAVLSNIAGSYTNTLSAGSVTTYEGVQNDEPTSARLVISSPPTLSKQFEPAVIAPGGSSRLTVFVGNPNSVAMTLSADLVDTLPTSPGPVFIAATPALGGTCPAAKVTATAGAGNLHLASGTVVPAGGCTIEVDVTAATPGAFTNVLSVAALRTDLGDNAEPAYAILSVSTLGYLSGKVFLDQQPVPDGVYVAGAKPLAGVAIELRDGATCAGPLVAGLTNPATTDAAGNYQFTGLPAGVYSVCQPGQPAGTLNGVPVAGAINSVGGSGGAPGVASNPAGGTPASQITGITLGASGGGEVSGSSGNNFSEVATASIAGQVFADQNNDGVRQGGDAALAGVSLTLSGSDWLGRPVSRSTTTDAGGAYRFADLPPGTYTVTEPTQPDDTSNGRTVAGAAVPGGTAGTATAVSTLPSAIAGIQLAPGTASVGNDFAEIPNGRSIYGRVFLDFDDNGVFGGGDTGIAGQTVLLTGTDVNGTAVDLSTVTGADGSFSFTGLPEGSSYTLTQPDQPAGTLAGLSSAGSAGGTATPRSQQPSQITGINLSGATLMSVDNAFGEVPTADLTLSKSHAPATFLAGGSGLYTLTPGNIGAGASVGTITVVDTLPAGLSAAGTPTGTGWSCSVAGQIVTCTSTTVIAAGSSGEPISLPVTVAGGLGNRSLTNTATIAGGGEPSDKTTNNNASDVVAIDGSAATLAGTVWRDLNHDRALDPGEPRLSGWTVELLRDGQLVTTTETDAQGAYRFLNVAPGSGYEVRFRDGAGGSVFGGAVPNERGLPFSPGVTDGANPAGADNSGGTLTGMTLVAGSNTVEQSLPLDPAGVVYDAVSRAPVAGAVVTLSAPGLTEAQVAGGRLRQTTGPDGFYQFLLLPGAPAGTYTITVTAPAGYVQGPSALIPVCEALLTVGGVPAPALVQNGDQAPGAGAPLHNAASCPTLSSALAAGAASTQYYFKLHLDGSSAHLLNNHIPLDPVTGAIVVTKTTPLVNVGKGGLVPYTITATNTLAAPVIGVDVRDRMPPGFQYRRGSGSVRQDGLDVFAPVEPVAAGRELSWRELRFAPKEQKTFRAVLVVGAGVGEGEYTNLAWAANSAGGQSISNIASAVVRITPEPVFDCADIIGKVFDDKNANGYQDQGEPGIPNARVATARGLLVTSDADGRFHVPCAAIPDMDRGANFVMKLDERTLPSGFRVTTENPRDVRVTRGKMVKINFGATVHKVVRVELDGRAFADGDELQAEWRQQLEQLPATLAQRPSVARLAYRLEAGESRKVAERRLSALAARLKDLYRKPPDGGGDRPPLIVETEVVTTGANNQTRGANPGAQGEQP